jgi:type II secretory pathway component GspD/PulD (secretin)
MKSVWHRWTAPALLALFVSGAVIAAPAGPASADPKKDLSPAEKVRKALDESIDISIDNQPLADAFKQLSDETKLNFVLDRFTIQQFVGDIQSVAVSVELKGVKVRSGLRTILSQHNLGYAIIGDTVLITTEDMAMHKQMRQRVSVDVDKVPVEKALKQLGKETGTNLLIDSRVAKESQTPVTLQVDDVPLETAVKLLAHMSSLRTVRVGNVLFVTTKETADEMRSDSDLVTTPTPQPGFREGGFGFGGVFPGQLVLPPLQAQPAQPAPVPDLPAPPKEEKPKEDKPKEDKP